MARNTSKTYFKYSVPGMNRVLFWNDHLESTAFMFDQLDNYPIGIRLCKHVILSNLIQELYRD